MSSSVGPLARNVDMIEGNPTDEPINNKFKVYIMGFTGECFTSSLSFSFTCVFPSLFSLTLASLAKFKPLTISYKYLLSL